MKFVMLERGQTVLFLSITHRIIADTFGRREHEESPYCRRIYRQSILSRKNRGSATVYDVLLGNVKGVRCPGIKIDAGKPSREAAALEICVASKIESKKLRTSQQAEVGLSVEDVKALQREDATLEQERKNAQCGEIVHKGNKNESNAQSQAAATRVLQCAVSESIPEEEEADEKGASGGHKTKHAISIEPPLI